MVYEAEMIKLARQARSSFGSLREVIFIETNHNSLLIFDKGTIPANDLTGMLTFGYYGTGPDCYASFLAELGFRKTNVKEVQTPAKLSKNGMWIHGEYGTAQWSEEVEGETIEDAKSKLTPVDQQIVCIIQEEVLSDGSQQEITSQVQAASDAKALSIVKAQRLPAGSTVLSSTVRKMTEETEEKITADTHDEATAQAQEEIQSSQAPYKSLIEVRCEIEPRKGFLGIGKHSGRFIAKYQTKKREVHIVYRSLARVAVLYGSKKHLCNQCGKVMTTTLDGVNYVGGQPHQEDQILKLRCDSCDITRFEKRWEIEGKWIDWEDNSARTII